MSKSTRIPVNRNSVFSKKTEEKVTKIIESIPPEKLGTKEVNLYDKILESVDTEAVAEIISGPRPL